MSEPADQRSRGSTGRTSPPSSGRVKGNQATYLFFPLFTSMILSLISSLSASLIPGLAVVEIHSTNQTISNNDTQAWSGVVKLGGVGMCIEGFENFTSTCIPYSLFGNNDRQLADRPAEILSLGIYPSPSDNTYKIINLVAHILASSSGIMAIIMVYGAIEEYRAKGRWAVRYTRRAWHANSMCLLLNIVPFGLDVALIPKAALMINRGDETSIGKVVPGATIYMSAAALTINLATFLVWLFWARRQPAPRWLQSDFIVNPKLPSPESFIATGSMVETGTQPAFQYNGLYSGQSTGGESDQNQVLQMLASEYPQHHQTQGWYQQAPGAAGHSVPVQTPQGLTSNNHAV